MLPIETIIAQGESETLEFKPSFNQDVIAQAFYDMGMIEQYGSGIKRVIDACLESGLPEPEFENFSGGFQIVFKPTAQVAAQETAQVKAHDEAQDGVGTPQVTPYGEAPVEAPVELSDTERKMLLLLESKLLGRKELISKLGYTQRTGNFIKAQKKLLEKGLIEMTIPDKPNSRFQKYRLTEKGKLFLKGTKS